MPSDSDNRRLTMGFSMEMCLNWLSAINNVVMYRYAQRMSVGLEKGNLVYRNELFD